MRPFESPRRDSHRSVARGNAPRRGRLQHRFFSYRRKLISDVTQPSQEVRAFLADVTAWCRTGSQAHLLRAFRSRFSGVPHDVAAAYAVVARRSGDLVDAIGAERLALSPADRDAVLAFSKTVRSLHELAEQHAGDDAIAAAAAAAFGIATEPDRRNGSASATTEAFELAEAVAPEAPGGVRGWKGHFSASALNAYAECPRKWYYRYVCAAVEDVSSGAATYGTAFHLALEDFHAEFDSPNAGNADAMRAKIPIYINTAFEKYANLFDNRLEMELQKRRARRTAQRYVDWLVAESQRAPFTVIGRELEARLEMEGFAFVGFIDRLDRDDATGATSVVDYKTGVIALSAEEYRSDVLAFRDFQLPFYYWARTAEGDRVTRLALLPLKDALLDVRPVSLEVVPMPNVAPARPGSRDYAATGIITIGELERARSRMIEICREVAAGAIETFAVATDPEACRYCVYVNACARRPNPAVEKFGR